MIFKEKRRKNLGIPVVSVECHKTMIKTSLNPIDDEIGRISTIGQRIWTTRQRIWTSVFFPGFLGVFPVFFWAHREISRFFVKGRGLWLR